MRVRFEWFEPGFDPDNNFFVDALNLHYGHVQVITDKLAKCELEIVSVHQPLKHPYLSRYANLRNRIPHGQPDINLLYTTIFEPETENFLRRIWYTAENLRPPLQPNIDGSISYDQDPLDGYNAYFPVWYALSGIQGPFQNDRVGKLTSADELLKSRQFQGDKTKFACAFIGKPEQMRLRAIAELSRIGQVDVFGPLVGKPIDNKSDVAKDYRFMVCFENDIYPGYVTEKILEAYLANTVPLYWGDLGKDTAINRKCYLNLTDFESMEEWVDKVRNLSDDAYIDIYEQAHLNYIPSLKSVYKILTG